MRRAIGILVNVLRAVVVCALATGCVQSASIVCGDAVCPTGYTCNAATSTCIDPADADACGGHPDGDPCAVRGLSGSCLDGLCVAAFCGDGRRTLSEDCDAADLGGSTCASLGYYGETTGLACKADCTFDRAGCVGACGDGIKNGDELCDGDDLGSPPADCTDAGFYDAPGLACSPFCTYDTTSCTGFCGDGVRDTRELCDGAQPNDTCYDLGYDVGTLGCSTGCGYTFDTCGRIAWQFETALGSKGTSFVHASAANDVWIVGYKGQAQHFDGVSWKAAQLGTVDVTSVWSAGAANAWASDAGNVLWHWNGTSWTTVSGAPTGIAAVWGTSATDLWTVGAIDGASGVHRWNGTSWSAVGTATDANLSIINGSSANDVWISNGSIVRHWTGASWSTAASVDATATVKALYAIGPSDAWAVGTTSTGPAAMRAHWNGSSWTMTPGLGGDVYSSVTGSATNDVWIGGDLGAVHYDGHAWLEVPTPQALQLFELDPGSVYGASPIAGYHYEGLAYAKYGPTSPPALMSQIFSSPDGNVFGAMQNATVAQFDGATWSYKALDSNAQALWGVSKSDVWAISALQTPYHFNGSSWDPGSYASLVSGLNALSNMWGSGTADIWFGGKDGMIRHFDGVSWGARDLTASSLSGVAVTKISGSGPNDVWARVANGRLFRWTGSWTEITSLPSAPDDIVVVGPNNVIAISGHTAYHGNAAGWTTYPLPNVASSPFRLVALGPSFVFGEGYQDLFLFDGTRWSLVRTPDIGMTISNIADLAITPNRVDLLFGNGALYGLLITQPWTCLAMETGHCGDAVDNDCDGKIDLRDSDCP